jgi:thiamine-phosphate pyrophosphorylase
LTNSSLSPAFCRLYLPSPPVLQHAGGLAAFETALDKALALRIDIACLRLSVAGLDDGAARDLLERIAAKVQPRGIALLVEDRADLVTRTKIDGVHLNHLPATLSTLRRQLGSDYILGVGCALSRHDAMLAGEAEADYVSFAGEAAALLEVAGWWAALMTVPCVAESVAGIEQAAALADAGAEFISPEARLWTLPDPAPTLRALAGTIQPSP